MDDHTELVLSAYPGSRHFGYPTTVGINAEEIHWRNAKGSGTLRYREITAIDLLPGDPDPGQRPDRCVMTTRSGVVLQVFCELGVPVKGQSISERRRAYSSFVRLLHQRLSAEDRDRILFRTDSKAPAAAERLIVWILVGSVILWGALYLLIGHLAALTMGWVVLQLVSAIAIRALIPKELCRYCPEPLDDKFLPH